MQSSVFWVFARPQWRHSDKLWCEVTVVVMKQRLCVCVFFPHYRSFWLETVFDYISQRASLWRTHGGHCVPRVSAVGPVNPSDASKLQTSTSCVSLCCGAIAGGLRKQLMGFLRIVSNCVVFLTTILVMCRWDGVLCANWASCVLTASNCLVSHADVRKRDLNVVIFDRDPSRQHVFLKSDRKN